MNRASCCSIRRALMVACLAPLLAAQAGLAEEQALRDLVRRYAKDGNGELIAKATGFSKPVEHVVALEYEVLLRVDGEEKAVDPDRHQFKLGDQVRVRIEPMVDTYIYIYHKGASGKHGILLPTEEEKAPFVKQGTPVELPGDGYFEFVPPPGAEELMVVATEEPISDLALLASTLFKQDDSLCTPEEQALKKKLTARVRKTLQSIRERHEESVTFRGLPTPEARKKFVQEVRRTGTTRAVVSESPGGESSGTFAMVASTEADDRPNLFVSIPLKSVAAPENP